jgi:uncharacterized protein (TIGR00369 family)
MPRTRLPSAHQRAWIQRAFRRLPIARQMGMKLAGLGGGKATLTLDPRREHLNRQGGLHGGVIATLVDIAMAMALLTWVPEGTRIATVEMKVNYLETHERGRLRARARVLRRGGRLAVGEVDVWDGTGVRVAKGLLTYALRPTKS